MQKLNIPVWNLILFIFYSITCIATEPVSDAYLSPEYLCATGDQKTLYVGLSDYPGVAVFDVNNGSVAEIISTPKPVAGLALDEKSGLLYAAARDEQSRVFVYDCNGSKFLDEIQVGYYPEELAISPSNNLLISANRFDNSISLVDLNDRSKLEIETGREPVALAVSPDEKLLVVAHVLARQASVSNYISADIAMVDLTRKAVIKTIGLPNGSYALKDVVFSKDGKYAYVTHLVGRINVLTSQIEKGWINTNALSMLDMQKQEWFTTVLLDDIYKGAANPYGMALSDDGKQLCIAVAGTNELFQIDVKGMHALIEKAQKTTELSQSVKQVSSQKEKIKVFQQFREIEQMGILFDEIPNELSFLATVRERIQLHAKGPVQVVQANGKWITANYFSDALEIIDLVEKGTKLVPIGNKSLQESKERLGEYLFHSAGHCFQQWQSCASCHPGKGRVDGLNWDLLNDGAGNPKNTKSLLYAHSTPPAMATGIRADAETGVRAGFKYIQFFDIPEDEAQAVDAWLKSLKPVNSPRLIKGSLSPKALEGKLVFEKYNCTACHSGPLFTDQKRHEMGIMAATDKQNRWDTPSLIELWRTAPYLHDGRYNDLKDVFRYGKHGVRESMDAEELENLTEYLLSL